MHRGDSYIKRHKEGNGSTAIYVQIFTSVTRPFWKASSIFNIDFK